MPKLRSSALPAAPRARRAPATWSRPSPRRSPPRCRRSASRSTTSTDIHPSLGATLDPRAATGKLRDLIEAITNADALIVGSPVYKGTYTGLFKHLFDLIEPKALKDKPIVLSATGGSERHALVSTMACGRCSRSSRPTSSPTGDLRHRSRFRRLPRRQRNLIARIDRVAEELSWRLGAARAPRVSRLRAHRLTAQPMPSQETIMLTRRQLFPLVRRRRGGAAPCPAGPRARTPATEFRIGWQKGGVLALAKRHRRDREAPRRRGMTVSWAEFTSGPPLLEALGANALDFGSTGDVPPLFAQAAGGDLVYVAARRAPSTARRSWSSRIRRSRRSPTSRARTSPSSAAPAPTISWSRRCASAGLTLDDVTAIDLPPAGRGSRFRQRPDRRLGDLGPVLRHRRSRTPTRACSPRPKASSTSWGFYFANGDFAKANPEIVADVIDELAQGRHMVAGRISTRRPPQLSEITGVPLDAQTVALGRKGTDLGDLHPLTEEALAYQQSLADEFYGLEDHPEAADHPRHRLVPAEHLIAHTKWSSA